MLKTSMPCDVYLKYTWSQSTTNPVSLIRLHQSVSGWYFNVAQESILHNRSCMRIITKHKNWHKNRHTLFHKFMLVLSPSNDARDVIYVFILVCEQSYLGKSIVLRSL